MPDKPSKTAVKKPVQKCGGEGAPKCPPWTMDCVRDIYCPADKATLEKLKHLKVVRFKKGTTERWYYDAKTGDWQKKPVDFDGGTTDSHDEVLIKADVSCEDAATILYHELYHRDQDKTLAYPSPRENEAYKATEQWTIDRGLGGWPGEGGPLRTTDTSPPAPDDAAIQRHVELKYGKTGAGTGEKVVGHHTIQGTKVRRADGSMYTRKPRDGDYYDAGTTLEEEETIPAGEFACPPAGKKKKKK